MHRSGPVTSNEGRTATSEPSTTIRSEITSPEPSWRMAKTLVTRPNNCSPATRWMRASDATQNSANPNPPTAEPSTPVGYVATPKYRRNPPPASIIPAPMNGSSLPAPVRRRDRTIAPAKARCPSTSR